VLAVRGTASTRDMYEDLSLYSEVLVMTGVNKLFPVLQLWPTKMVQRLVQAMAVTEGVFFDPARDHYHLGVLRYVDEAIGAVPSPHVKLLVVGHSLDGAVAHAVAATLHRKGFHVQSVAFSPCVGGACPTAHECRHSPVAE